ncbi:MAG: PIN domain-containing protein [Solirubrobacterales bacterium]
MSSGALYIDTSALGRVLLGEPDSRAVLDALAGYDQHVSSRILGLELRRLALRHDVLADAEQLLSAVALIPLTDSLMAAAEAVAPPSVAALDAIHLATALDLSQSIQLAAILTYDQRLADGAAHHGIQALAPAG